MDKSSMHLTSDITKVAFISLSFLGDLLCLMPLITQYNKVFPESSITLVVQKSHVPLLPFLPLFDRAIILSKGIEEITLKDVLRVKKNKRYSCDLAVHGEYYVRHTNILLWALKAKERVAVVRHRWYAVADYWVNRPVSRQQFRKSRYLPLRYLNLLFPEFDEIPECLYPKLLLPKNIPLSQIPGSSVLDNNNIPVMFISVTNNRPLSSLGVNLHAEILNTLYKTQPFRVLISYLPQNIYTAYSLVDHLLAPASVVHTADFADLLLVMNKADLVFVGDGGIMHIAAALDKFQVVLFGKTEIAMWKPLSKKAVCLRHPEGVANIPKNAIIEALLLQLDRQKHEKTDNKI